jgi:hypothetical protein
MAQVRWSEDPREVVSHCLAGNAVAFSVERRLALVATRRVDFLVVPLRDVVRLDRADERSPFGPAQADHWLIWQSLTERGCATALPTDPEALATRLGIAAAGPDALMARAGLRALVDAAYGRHSL